MSTEIIKILEQHGIKPTAMRILTLEQLWNNPQEHFSLSDLEIRLSPADRVTIYRSLQTFVKKGIAHTSENIEGTSVYAYCSEECSQDAHLHHHPHFICEKCKRTTCTDNFHYNLELGENAANYTIKEIELTIRGICSDCNK